MNILDEVPNEGPIASDVSTMPGLSWHSFGQLNQADWVHNEAVLSLSQSSTTQIMIW